MHARRKLLPIAVLISGGGTTLRNLIQKIAEQQLDAEIRLVIATRAKAAGLRFAADAGIPSHVVRTRDFDSVEAFSNAIFQPCRDAGTQLVVMGGFLKHVLVPNDFVQRVVNIHPALIPAFCGKGYYGHHVHQAVLEYGVKVSGCTVHFVDDHYDHGPIIIQRTVPVLDDDTADTLAARVFQQECVAYPQAIQWYAEGRLHIDGRRVRVS